MLAIKNYSMPECCFGCMFIDFDHECFDVCCGFTGVNLVDGENIVQNRHSSCPLIEIDEKEVAKKCK